MQKNAKDNETFSPHHISFTAEAYESMVRVMKLPFRAIETTSVVGPFFWAACDQDDEDPHLRKLNSSLAAFSRFPVRLTPRSEIIFRKSDVRKKGKTRGWELMLSHSFRTSITTGYVKGTPSSDINQSIAHLKSCAAQVGHPMLLPIIILSHDLSSKNDQKQRDARDWLRRLEHAVSMRNEIKEDEGYVKDGVMDMDSINRDLVECHSQVLWKRPQAYQEIVAEIQMAMHKFWRGVSADQREGDLDKLHRSMLSRLDFYFNKLRGIENYAFTTLERLKIQREAVSLSYPNTLRCWKESSGGD